jgi:hypothetical protein
LNRERFAVRAEGRDGVRGSGGSVGSELPERGRGNRSCDSFSVITFRAVASAARSADKSVSSSYSNPSGRSVTGFPTMASPHAAPCCCRNPPREMALSPPRAFQKDPARVGSKRHPRRHRLDCVDFPDFSSSSSKRAANSAAVTVVVAFVVASRN